VFEEPATTDVSQYKSRLRMPERFRLSNTRAIVVGVGLLSLGLSLWQLTQPGYIDFYDSGVYFAASFHLISGALPYRDFSFVQPPGILVLLSPVALVGRIFGTHDGFIVGRVLSAVVTALNASLLALLVRHRGRTAMLIAGGGLALMPVASFVSSGLRLEPYLIFFVLIGSLMVFPRHAGGNASTLRLALGGLLFGVAAAVKLWAFFPFIALAICLVPRFRSRVLAFVGAAATGFIVLCLPFFLAAPRAFVSEVFTEQLGRKANATNDGGVIFRLKTMTGFIDTSLAPTSKEVVIAFVALLLIVAVAYSRRMGHETVDVYLLVAASISVAGLLVGPDSYDYYGYFTAPFLLGVLGISVARLAGPIRKLLGADRAPPALRRIGSGAYAIGGVALLVALVIEGTQFYTSYAAAWGYSDYPYSAITNLIPAGSCVVYNQVSYGMFSNRLQSSTPNCPDVVDPTGMWMACGYQLLTPPPPRCVARWKSYFETAQYVVLSLPHTPGVAWNPSLTAWFKSDYYLLFGQPYIYIYARNS
jgi:hypothetical protein